MKKGRLFSTLLSTDTAINFYENTNQAGAMGLTIRNIGQTVLVIDDHTQEEIMPGDYFFIENTIPIVNTDFKIRFKNEDGKNNLAVMRYIVPLDF